MVQLDHIKVEFEGQGHRSKFTVTGRKMRRNISRLWCMHVTRRDKWQGRLQKQTWIWKLL